MSESNDGWCSWAADGLAVSDETKLGAAEWVSGRSRLGVVCRAAAAAAKLGRAMQSSAGQQTGVTTHGEQVGRVLVVSR